MDGIPGEEMSLFESVSLNRNELLAEWKRSSELFPGGGRFFSNLDPFANPVAHTVDREMGLLLGALLGEADEATTNRSLDAIIRIQAVQDSTPAQALGFLRELKQIITESAIAAEADGSDRDGAHPLTSEIIEIHNRVDDLIYRGFDIYMKCREQIFRLKLDQAVQGEPLKRGCPSSLLDGQSQMADSKQVSVLKGESQ
jgi:hypothetical protein